MAPANQRSIWSDDSGAVILEMTVTVTLFLTVLFGTVEGGNLFYQWNIATKATQLGARIAAVSDPVSISLRTMDATSNHPCSDGFYAAPGDPITSSCFDITCVSTAQNGATGTCNGDATDYDAAAMRAIIFGRGDTAYTASDCGNATNPRTLGMCDVFPRIKPQNVVVRYQFTGLGYAGRPGGMVPTITVSLTGLQFNWVALNGLLGLGPITMPGLKTTITGEDLQGS